MKIIKKLMSIVPAICILLISLNITTSAATTVYKNGNTTTIVTSSVWAWHGGKQAGETTSTSNGGNRSNHYNNRLYWYEGYSIDMCYFGNSTYTAFYGSKTYLYCIEPWKSYGSGTFKIYTDGNATGNITTSSYWTSLSNEKRRLLAQATMYGFPSRTPAQLGVSTDDDAFAATQCVIWEIVSGRRTASGWNTSYKSNSTEAAVGISGLKDNVYFYRDKYMKYAYTGNGHTAGENTPAMTAYNKIWELIGKHETLASFNGQTLTLTYDTSSKTYKGSITDSNGILSDSSLTSSLPSGCTYSKSGNTITFTSTQPINTAVSLTFKKNQSTFYNTSPLAVLAVTSGSGQHMMCGTVNDPKYFTINIKTSSGTLNIYKSSDDGIVSGMQFRITGTGVDQTVTTNSSGQASIVLPVGTFTVAEINTPARYQQPSSKSVSITNGGTASLYFSNLLNTKSLTIRKTSEDGYISGLKFRITGNGYDNTVTTAGLNGTVSVSLPAGTYTITEVDTPSRYVQPAAQTVTLDSNKTVTFYNALKQGYVSFVNKCTFYDGYLSGAVFGVYKSTGTDTGIRLTSSSTSWVSQALPIGSYYLQMITPPTNYALNTTQYPFTVSADQTTQVTTYSTPLADLYPELVMPNRSYRSGIQVIVSYKVYNNSVAEWTDSRPLSTTFSAYSNGTRFYNEAKSIVVPQNSANLVYFKFTIPSGTSTLRLDFSVDSPSSVVETNTGNNTVSNSFTISNSIINSQTPDTKFENTPNSFILPSPYAAVPTMGDSILSSATWQEWTCSGGAFSLKTYGITVDADYEVIPDSYNPSYYKNNINNKWVTKSGYGFQLNLISVIRQYLSYALPSSNSYTFAQSANIYFPEYQYSSDLNKFRTLVPNGTNKLSFVKNPYTIDEYGLNDYRPIHFIPIWFPDTTYVMKAYVYDFWTPAGMLNVTGTIDKLEVKGDMYDDWYIQQRRR